ncbi:MAG: flavodoxin domain-containing protein [Holophagales bacterium]|jgi:menaquinone-dependent protoporphyrinogen IX oxidase|nr:flavodoxin domain-containing protein [Holophagales bacterium]
MMNMEKNKRIAVIYKSAYGTTKRYAEWIADELDAELMEYKTVSSSLLGEYDIIVYGGGLYASGILGADLVAKRHCENIVLFTVGLANPAKTDYTEIMEKSGLTEGAGVFHLRGGIDYKKLNLVHKGMMAMMKKMSIDKKSYEELNSEERAFVDTYGGKVDFTDKGAIAPLIEYVRSLQNKEQHR